MASLPDPANADFGGGLGEDYSAWSRETGRHLISISLLYGNDPK